VKIKKQLFLKKRFFLPFLLFLIIILTPILFLASIYFSPSRVRNFPIGEYNAQINFTPGGINIFYPKDETTTYYSHNFSWPPQEMIGPSKFSDPNSGQTDNISTFFKKWLTSFFDQFKFKQQDRNDRSNEQSPIKQISEQIQKQLPQTEQTFSSNLLDLQLTVPKGFNLTVDRQANAEIINIVKDNENKMSLMIFPADKGCKDTDYSSGRWDPLRIKIARKYQVTFTHSSVSHGDSGHSYGAQAMANNEYCIAVSMNINIQNQKEFTTVLEGN
jgi:hypothetical protein